MEREKKLFQMSKFYLHAQGVKEEVKFYDNAKAVQNGVEKFRDEVRREDQEFDKLLEYFHRHHGRIDVHNRSRYGPSKPNLGTDDESWYYLDSAGNKIWVRNQRLDTSNPKCGAFDALNSVNGRVVSVIIPQQKRNYCTVADYRRKCAEYDQYRRRPGPSRDETRRAPSAQGRVDPYVASQQAFGHSLNNSRDEYVFRPPATFEEAEERLKELRDQEGQIRLQLEAVPLPKYY